MLTKPYMRLDEFIAESGIPRTVMRRALKGEYRNQVGRKITPGKENSPWLIDTQRTLKLYKEGFIG